MTICGIQIRFDCKNGEQFENIGKFWNEMRALCPEITLSGVGFGWENDTLCYLIGTETGVPTKAVSAIQKQFPEAEHTAIHLPDDGWKTYTATADTLDVLYAEIYKDGPLDYEIERFGADGRAEILIFRKDG